MNKQKIIIAILGSSIVAGLGTAMGFFPDLKTIMIAVSGLVVAIVGLVNGANNSE